MTNFMMGFFSLLYKKGDMQDINNWRHLTLMNLDYKIFAKIIMNRMSEVLDGIISMEQTCTVKGSLMWDNLNSLRELVFDKGDQ